MRKLSFGSNLWTQLSKMCQTSLKWRVVIIPVDVVEKEVNEKNGGLIKPPFKINFQES